MAAVPATPKKEGKENYYPQQRNCWQKFFLIIYLFDSVAQICRFVEGIYSICTNNCYFVNHKVYCKINIPLQLC